MIDSSTVTRFGLLRHARTLWNLEKRIQGRHDSPLSSKGEVAAREWGITLRAYPWDRILSSDAGRAVQSAELINAALQLPISFDPRLREQDWGGWTGKTIAQLGKEDPDELARQEAAGWDFRPPDGENRLQVWARGSRALTAAAERWPGQALLVVTHEGMIRCLVYRLYEREFLPTEPVLLRKDHLHWLAHANGVFRMEQVNGIALSAPVY